MIRTRFAPSPTGYMHIGNLRTALYEYLIAKSEDGKFILRIEDTDQERQVEGAVEIIYNTLKMTGLVHDEGPDIGGDYGPYVQSERMEMYLEYAIKLVESDQAYYCFCTKERLDQLKENNQSGDAFARYDRHCMHLSKKEIQENLVAKIPYVIRQKMPTEGTTTFEDVVYGSITVENAEIDDQILIKSDGYPTYNFANVIDDHLMDITHVVRGSEYLSSTPKYNLLYHAFDWIAPIYVHLPPVMKDQQHKLSKRNGDASFEDLVAKGYLVDAIMNYIALLGWSPSDNVELFTLEELKKKFSVTGLSKSPSIFDSKKLGWMNGEYIKRLTVEQFCEMATPWIKQGLKLEVDYMKIAKILQTRVNVLNEIPELLGFLDTLPEYDIAIYTHKKMKTDPAISLTSLLKAKEALEGVCNWTEETIHETLFAAIAEMGIKNGQMLWPVRTALTGMESTPGGALELADILGKEETLKRIGIGIEKLA